MARTCSLYKTLPASKIAKCPYDSPTLTCAKGAKTGTHEEYQRFAAWSLERLVRNVYELAKNFSWNEGAALVAIRTHNKKSSAVYLLMFGMRIKSPDSQARVRW
jgi:hypothetical protein